MRPVGPALVVAAALLLASCSGAGKGKPTDVAKLPKRSRILSPICS